MICFYHRGDLDGRCSAAIVKHRFPGCQMIGIDYGEPFPWDKAEGQEVVMVDFSLQPFDQMLRLDHCSGLTWIDHHKSAIADHADVFERWIGPCRLDSNFAACELTWKWAYPDQPMPHAVYLLGRYDIWKHEEVEGALEFQYGCRGYETSLLDGREFWKDVLKSNGSWIGSVQFDGRKFLRYEQLSNKGFCSAYAFECELDGLKCIAANRGMSNSLLFESVYDPSKHHAMLMFAWKGTSWTISLYSTREDVDVSVIAKARGGGGHKGAAGFQTLDLPFLPMEPRQ